MAAQGRQDFVSAVEKAHSRQLRRFLALRLRHSSADVPDLMQEIYLRLLRLKDHDAIRNPQAYLYTIASHVLHQYTLKRAAIPESMDPLDAVQLLQSETVPDPLDEADIEQRVLTVGRLLEAESPRAYAALVMYRCEGLTLKQIGERLGISHVMARKYLVRAIRFCDEHLQREKGR